jgi:hypothetical protein
MLLDLPHRDQAKNKKEENEQVQRSSFLSLKILKRHIFVLKKSLLKFVGKLPVM